MQKIWIGSVQFDLIMCVCVFFYVRQIDLMWNKVRKRFIFLSRSRRILGNWIEILGYYLYICYICYIWNGMDAKLGKFFLLLCTRTKILFLYTTHIHILMHVGHAIRAHASKLFRESIENNTYNPTNHWIILSQNIVPLILWRKFCVIHLCICYEFHFYASTWSQRTEFYW